MTEPRVLAFVYELFPASDDADEWDAIMQRARAAGLYEQVLDELERLDAAAPAFTDRTVH